jgi:hypothetical protein
VPVWMIHPLLYGTGSTIIYAIRVWGNLSLWVAFESDASVWFETYVGTETEVTITVPCVRSYRRIRGRTSPHIAYSLFLSQHPTKITWKANMYLFQGCFKVISYEIENFTYCVRCSICAKMFASASTPTTNYQRIRDFKF